MELKASLLSLLIPVGFSASVGQRNSTTLEQNKVLHDYAYNVTLDSLRERSYLLEGIPDSLPETGFVLVKGSATILDYGTLKDMAKHWDDIHDLFDPPKNDKAKRERRKSEESAFVRDVGIVLDTFFKDTVRVRLTDSQGNHFIGPLMREHLREDIRSLIYKHGSNPKGEWTVLAEISRIPEADASVEDLMRQLEGVEPVDSDQVPVGVQQLQDVFDKLEQEQPREQPLSNVIDPFVAMLNALQEQVNSPSSTEIAVSPTARDCNNGAVCRSRCGRGPGS